MRNYKDARKKIASWIKVNHEQLDYVLYRKKVENLYECFKIPKKNGEYRVIYAPQGELKVLQRRLSQRLYEVHSNYIGQKKIKSSISHGFEQAKSKITDGFEQKKSIITNAYRHKNKKYLLNMDISNFFPSFHFGRVQGFFYKSKEFNFSKEEATIIAQLVCYNGSLPQGAPTSPIISNLIFNIVDLRILSLAKKYKLHYTRYADDLSFSTNHKSFKDEYSNFIQELTELLNQNGFDVNQDKTRLEYYFSRQEVTGLSVNKKINAKYNFINTTRAMADQLYRTNQFYINGETGSLEQLEGRFSFINQLDWFNNNVEFKVKKNKHNKRYNFGFNTREKQYQYFLFYKYFFKPHKATIVTEGKTDILHLKAALMKYSDRYPNLIIKKDDGTYEFKIYFLNKTKRLEYFLGISIDGADTMKNIWNFYKGMGGCFNIFDYLSEKNKAMALSNINPVILLFDNEQNKNRPLKKFLNYTNINLEKGQICQKLYSNLYLQVIPLINKLKMCEIEDLYLEKTLNLIIKGKKFSRDENLDTNKYYGKGVFSKYIIEHYNEIDFSNFIKLLDSIDCICRNH